jgi:hypothetical protein
MKSEQGKIQIKMENRVRRLDAMPVKPVTEIDKLKGKLNRLEKAVVTIGELKKELSWLDRAAVAMSDELKKQIEDQERKQN